MSLFAYLRVSSDSQDVQNQNMGVSDYCAKNFPNLVPVYVEDTASGTVAWQKRAIGNILLNARSGDIVVASEVSRLARNTLQVLEIMRHCAENNIQLHLVKSNIVLDGSMQSKITATIFGLAAEIERDFISSRTKEALARKKAQGIKLGRPAGKAERLKLDKKAQDIDSLIQAKVAKRAIARVMGVSANTLYHWLKVRRGQGIEVSA